MLANTYNSDDLAKIINYLSHYLFPAQKTRSAHGIPWADLL